MSRFTGDLIKIVKTYPFLFDYTHPDFRNMKKKENTWQLIGKSLLVSGSKAKKKWKNVRDNYAKYVRATKEDTQLSEKVIERYRSWPWGKEVEFLKPFLQPPRGEIRVMTLQDNSENQTTLWPTENSLHSDEVHLKFEESTLETQSSEEYNWQDQTTISSDNRKRKAIEEINLQTISVNQIPNYSEKRDYDDNFTYDDIDLIFLGYAKTIKKFPPRRQSILKFKFARLIMEEELKDDTDNDDIRLLRESKTIPDVSNVILIE